MRCGRAALSIACTRLGSTCTCSAFQVSGRSGILAINNRVQLRSFNYHLVIRELIFRLEFPVTKLAREEIVWVSRVDFLVNSQNVLRLDFKAAFIALVSSLGRVNVVDVRVEIRFSGEHFIAMLTLESWRLKWKLR